MDNAEAAVTDLVGLLSGLDDPRALDGRRHRLGDILVIAFCTVLCGQEEFTAMQRFGLEKQGWLRGFLALTAGIPSHDTFRAVLCALDAKQLAQTLITWTEGVREKLGRPEIVAIDGKSARRSGASAKAALHLVNAWAVDNGLCLGQEQTSEKSNEITAVPLLLRQLELAGCLVTVDALNTQKAIAREIREADADYVLALKGNHPLLHQEVSDFLLDAHARGFAGVAHDFFEEADKGHGRLEIRRHWITAHIGWITPRAEWEGLRCVGLVERERHTAEGVSVERAFYLCSIAPDAPLFARAVRGHWGVENSLHWRLDVIFQEDQCRARTRFAAANLAALRKLALNAARADRSVKDAVKGKLFRAAISDDFRLHLLRLNFGA